MYDYSSKKKENDLFALISCLMDVTKTAYEEGIVFLQEDIAGYPRDILLFRTVQRIAEAIICEKTLEEICEMIAEEYSEAGREKSFVLLCVRAIYFKISQERLERYLMQGLTEKEKHDYFRYWKQSVSEHKLGCLINRRRRGV